MFHSYFFPISYAFMMFPIAALIFTLPFLIVQYRRHGYIHKLRALILYLLLLYLMNAYFLVLLPMPSSRHNMAPSGSMMQLVPLQFIQDIIDGSKIIPDQISTYWSLLREPAFLQVIFNIALTVPFGLFLGYYFRTRWECVFSCLSYFRYLLRSLRLQASTAFLIIPTVYLMSMILLPTRWEGSLDSNCYLDKRVTATYRTTGYEYRSFCQKSLLYPQRDCFFHR